MIQRIEISKDKRLEPGDLIEIHFKTIGGTWIKSTHIATIEWQLAGRSDFEIVSSGVPDDHSLYFEIRIKKTNPTFLTAALIGAIIIGAGVLAWLTLDKVYQILESPAGKIFVGGFGALAAVVAVVIVLNLLSKK